MPFLRPVPRARDQLLVVLQPSVHLVPDRGRLPRVAARRDDEVIGEGAHRPHVEDDDVLRQLLLCESGDAAGLFEGAQADPCPCRGRDQCIHVSRTSRGAVEAPLPDQVARRHPGRGRSAAPRRPRARGGRARPPDSARWRRTWTRSGCREPPEHRVEPLPRKAGPRRDREPRAARARRPAPSRRGSRRTGRRRARRAGRRTTRRAAGRSCADTDRSARRRRGTPRARARPASRPGGAPPCAPDAPRRRR